MMDHRAKVWHFVSDNRCRFSYFLSRCYAEGISKAQVTANVGSGDGLSTERAYATRTLPLGVLGASPTCSAAPVGLGRAGAIIAGLGMTAVGYIGAKLSAATAKPDQAPRLQTT